MTSAPAGGAANHYILFLVFDVTRVRRKFQFALADLTSCVAANRHLPETHHVRGRLQLRPISKSICSCSGGGVVSAAADVARTEVQRYLAPTLE